MAKLIAFFTLVLIASVGVLLPPFLKADASAPIPTDVWKPVNAVVEKLAPVPKKEEQKAEYLASKGYQLVKAKIGHSLAKYAYDEVLRHQKDGKSIDLTMWYTLVNYRENPKWNFRAVNNNGNGSFDCGLGQVNKKGGCTSQDFEPYYAIRKSIAILASKNEMVGGAKWHTFKRYNGGGVKAEQYATVCWQHYTRLKSS